MPLLCGKNTLRDINEEDIDLKRSCEYCDWPQPVTGEDGPWCFVLCQAVNNGKVCMNFDRKVS